MVVWIRNISICKKFPEISSFFLFLFFFVFFLFFLLFFFFNNYSILKLFNNLSKIIEKCFSFTEYSSYKKMLLIAIKMAIKIRDNPKIATSNSIQIIWSVQPVGNKLQSAEKTVFPFFLLFLRRTTVHI